MAFVAAATMFFLAGLATKLRGLSTKKAKPEDTFDDAIGLANKAAETFRLAEAQAEAEAQLRSSTVDSLYNRIGFENDMLSAAFALRNEANYRQSAIADAVMGKPAKDAS